MRFLLDESVPVQVQSALIGHDVATVSGLGWKGIGNGELLVAAEKEGFDVLVIADKNLRYQQNLRDYRSDLTFEFEQMLSADKMTHQ